MYKYSSSDMLFSSYYDENQLDLLVFSNPFIPFFTTTCSDPIDDIAQSEIINSNHHHHSSSPLDHPFSHLERQSSLVYDYQGNQDEEQPQPTYVSALEGSELKISSSEEWQMGGVVDINTYNNNHVHVDPHRHSYVGDAASEVDANSYEAAPQHPDILMDSPNFHHWHATTLTPLQNSFFTGQLRRVFSAADLQSRRLLEEANLNNNNKVGRYSPEERKEKIYKYRAKRSRRKFNKTIKYACRKTLADNRARIRGRFARNDVILPQCSTGDDEFWIDLIERLLNDEEVLS